LTRRKQTTPLKMGQHLKTHPTKEHTQLANKHPEECSVSYVIRELQIKTTTHPLEWPKSRRLTTPNASEPWNNRSSPSLLVGKQNGTATLEDSLAVSHKTKHTLGKLSVKVNKQTNKN